MSSDGAWTGVGIGLSRVADNIRAARHDKTLRREKEADKLESQLDQIAKNKAQIRQELGMIPQGTPDYVSKAGELQAIEDTLQNATQAYHALGVDDEPWLRGRLKAWFGKKQPQKQPYVQGATQTPELLSAAAERPDFKETDAFKRHQAGLTTELGIDSARKMAPVNREITGENAKYMADIQTELTEKTNAATIEWAKKHGLSEELLQDLNATLAGIPATILAREKVAPKPLDTVISDKMLVSIKDPNSGTTYHAGNIDAAPPEVKSQWESISKQQAEERKRDEETQDKRNKEAEKRQLASFQQALTMSTKAFQDSLDRKDYETARKLVSEGEDLYQGAVDRQRVMDQNLKDANKGDQQAMLSLVANHIGMTLGAQKGARINQAVWNEAIASTPWLDKIGAKFSGDGYLSGVTLAPEQMKSMVNLAHEKVANLKEHVKDVNERYKDVLKINAQPGDLKDSVAPKTSIDDDILGLISRVKTGKKK